MVALYIQFVYLSNFVKELSPHKTYFSPQFDKANKIWQNFHLPSSFYPDRKMSNKMKLLNFIPKRSEFSFNATS